MDNEQHEYPLWCIDRGHDYDDAQYMGPYTFPEEARTAAQEAWEEDREPRDEGAHPYAVRRCRRARVSELPFARRFFDWLVETMNENASEDPPTGECWARWDDTLVSVPDKSAEFVEGGFWAWADLCLRVDIFIIEPAKEEP